MTVVPIPAQELKSHAWYYGIHCTCKRVHVLCEDLFAGKTNNPQMPCSPPIAVACECGRVTYADRLDKFRTP